MKNMIFSFHLVNSATMEILNILTTIIFDLEIACMLVIDILSFSQMLKNF